MTPRDTDQLASEVDMLWKKHDELDVRVDDSEKASIRYEGKLDSLLESFARLMDKSNCVAHGRDLEDMRNRVRTIECSYVTKQDLEKLREDVRHGLGRHEKGLEKLKTTLWGLGLIIIASIIAVGVDNIYNQKHQQAQTTHQSQGLNR